MYIVGRGEGGSTQPKNIIIKKKELLSQFLIFNFKKLNYLKFKNLKI
jgi:hypothetical protein